MWQQARITERTGRVFDRLCTGPTALAALRALTLIDAGVPDAAAAYQLLDLLCSLAVLEVVPDELLGTEDETARVAGFASRAEWLLARASRPRERAVAHWLAAVGAERRGAIEEAESQLRSAVRADPGWPAAEDRLAWYESDCGAAAAAAARWRRLGRTAGQRVDLATVERFEATADDTLKLGRSQPAGAGRVASTSSATERVASRSRLAGRCLASPRCGPTSRGRSNL